ncbi:hypothetical protein J3R30DRAFT_3406525 [Lentinula aciculospora]|uniref:Uncharacterized protein n=1 Tax=Lentinula aciculospora TaxID=153920 RepID=A0A9W9A3H4_9AGAR|nr:hypothetical protein J3R30DRAFT_3406525 [Lentinula aciculospora]
MFLTLNYIVFNAIWTIESIIHARIFLQVIDFMRRLERKDQFITNTAIGTPSVLTAVLVMDWPLRFKRLMKFMTCKNIRTWMINSEKKNAPEGRASAYLESTTPILSEAHVPNLSPTSSRDW